MSGSVLDPVLEIMVKLKNSWTLTGELSTGSMKFSTEFYDDGIQFPQVVVAQVAGSSTPPLSTGTSGAIYRDTDVLNVQVWVRPKQDSNTSKGWAKNAFYQVRREIERIIRSGSSLGADADGDYRFAWHGEWRRLRRVGDSPLLLSSAIETRIVKNVEDD